jgi:hypothetical protein
VLNFLSRFIAREVTAGHQQACPGDADQDLGLILQAPKSAQRDGTAAG